MLEETNAQFCEIRLCDLGVWLTSGGGKLEGQGFKIVYSDVNVAQFVGSGSLGKCGRCRFANRCQAFPILGE